jgi:hypothetical protein
MSTDIGTIADRSVDEHARTLWRESPEAAFAGNGLYSAEAIGHIHSTRPELRLSFAVVTLATNDPERFLSLTSQLTPIIQDILIQYYLLGRTYWQIGSLLFPGRSLESTERVIRDGHGIGLSALALSIRSGESTDIRDSDPLWRNMLEWTPREKDRRSVRVKTPRDLGDFIIVPNGQLGELFAPAWGMFNRAGQ